MYKSLYNDNTKRQPGTLSYFKHLLRRPDVNRRVKSNYQAHCDRLKIVVNGLLMEQLSSFFHMENEIDKPKSNVAHRSRKYRKCNNVN